MDKGIVQICTTSHNGVSFYQWSVITVITVIVPLEGLEGIKC